MFKNVTWGLGAGGGGEDLEQCHQMSHGREGGLGSVTYYLNGPLHFIKN